MLFNTLNLKKKNIFSRYFSESAKKKTQENPTLISQPQVGTKEKFNYKKNNQVIPATIQEPELNTKGKFDDKKNNQVIPGNLKVPEKQPETQSEKQPETQPKWYRIVYGLYLLAGFKKVTQEHFVTALVSVLNLIILEFTGGLSHELDLRNACICVHAVPDFLMGTVVRS